MIIREDKNTEVLAEEVFRFNAPHNFKVIKTDDQFEAVGQIHFQEGPVKEFGVNGVSNEDVLAMVICRLEHFQKSEFSCFNNTLVLAHLNEAMKYLNLRTAEREGNAL